MKLPIRREKKLRKAGLGQCFVCIDEAGRGALAGAVVAAAVSVETNTILKILKETNNALKTHNLQWKDSKSLSPSQREKFYRILIHHKSIQWGIGIVSEKIIEKINIQNASELAMEKALQHLEKKMKKKVRFFIVDGNRLNNQKLKMRRHQLLVKADEKIFSCAAASIIAKVTRDRMMLALHKKYPQYGFNAHKGYPTKRHRRALRTYGAVALHRKSFRPVSPYCQL